MSKFISDSEILRWNEKLRHTNYSVYPKYHSANSHPMIVFKQKLNPRAVSLFGNLGDVETIDPQMKFTFSFSVATNRVENFFHIFEKWFSTKVSTKTYYQNNNDVEKISDIEVSEKIVESKEQQTHLVKDKQYTRFVYHFNGKLSSIMMYVLFLEDTIDIFSKIWSYLEDGQEIQLTKFSIGDFVSKCDDRSTDYLVLDFHPVKIDKQFFINYEICTMNYRGQVIQWGESEFIAESKICPSRNSRIDNILDDDN